MIRTIFAITVLLLVLPSGFAPAAQPNGLIGDDSAALNPKIKSLYIVRDEGLILSKRTKGTVWASLRPKITEQEFNIRYEPPIEDRKAVCWEGDCAADWDFGFADQPVEVDRRNRALIQWTQLPTENIPLQSVDITVQPADGADRPITYQAAVSKRLDILADNQLDIDMQKAGYTEKDYPYLLKRELGLPVNTLWRHVQDKDHLVLQTRIDLSCTQAGLVRVVTKSPYRPTSVQFSIDRDGNGFKDGFILFNQTEHTWHLNDGELALVVNLSKYFREFNCDKGALVEVIVHMPMTFKQYIKAKPIKEIGFYRLPANDLLVKTTVDPDGQGRRAEIDLSKIAQNHPQGKITQLSLHVRTSAPQLFELNRLVFEGSIGQPIPVVLGRAANALAQWTDRKPESIDPAISFKPLLVSWFGRTTPCSIASGFTWTPFKDQDVEVQNRGKPYRLTKSQEGITLQGVRDAEGEKLKLILKPKDRSQWLTFKFSGAEVIASRIGGQTPNLDLSFILPSIPVRIDPGSTIELTILPGGEFKPEHRHGDWSLSITAVGQTLFTSASVPHESDDALNQNRLTGAVVRGCVGPLATIPKKSAPNGLIRFNSAIGLRSIAVRNGRIASDIHEEWIRGATPITFEASELWRQGLETKPVVILFDTYLEPDVLDRQWWTRSDKVFFSPTGVSDHVWSDGQGQRWARIQFIERNGRKLALLKPAKKDFIYLTNILLPLGWPSDCKAYLNIGRCRLEVNGENFSVPPQLGAAAEDPILEIQYHGPGSVLNLPLPAMKVAALRRRLVDLLGKDRLRIKGHSYAPKARTVNLWGPGWVDLGRVDFEAGLQTFKRLADDDFQLGEVALLTDDGPKTTSDPAAVWDDNNLKFKALTKALKLFGLAAGLLAAVGLAGTVVIWSGWVSLRGKKGKLASRAGLFKTGPWSISPKFKAVVGAIIAVSLYLYIFYYNDTPSNLWAVMAALISVWTLRQACQALGTSSRTVRSRTATSLLKTPTIPMVYSVIFLLLITAVLWILGLNSLSQNVSFIVFYCLLWICFTGVEDHPKGCSDRPDAKA